MGDIVELHIDSISTPLPPGVTVDWRRYQRAKDAYFNSQAGSPDHADIKRQYYLEAVNMASWLDVILQGEPGKVAAHG